MEGQKIKILEEILDLEPLIDTTTVQDILNAVKISLDFYKVQRMRRENPHLMNFHCLIHQENLTAKMGMPEAERFSDFVMKVINIVINGSLLKHRQSNNFLKETESEIATILKMNQVRWLSVEKTLNQFIKIVEEIKTFIKLRKIPIST